MNSHSINVDIFRHKNFENRSIDGGEMAGFCKTFNLSQNCQINVLHKYAENCVISIQKKNLMNKMSSEDIFLFYKTFLLMK